MSGIIGGAGSKSGIIGTIELVYEEGVWTPGLGASNGGSSGTWGQSPLAGKYIITGNLVSIWYSFSGTNMKLDTSGKYQEITGVPLSAWNPTGMIAYIGSWGATSVASGNGGNLMLYNSTVMYMYNSSVSPGTVDSLSGQVTYRIE